MEWMPLYWARLLTATAGWPAEALGAYMRLLIHQWAQGHLPDDIETLEGIASPVKDFARLWPRYLAAKFKASGEGQLQNETVEEIRSEQEEKLDRRRRAARKRWADADQKHEQSTSNASALHEQCTSNADAMHEQCSDNRVEKSREDKRRIPPSPLGASRPTGPQGKIPSLESFDPPYDGERFRAALSDRIASRREQRKPITPGSLAWRNERKLLVELGEEAATEALLESVRSGWQGVFPPKGRPGKTGALPGAGDGLRSLSGPISAEAQQAISKRQAEEAEAKTTTERERLEYLERRGHKRTLAERQELAAIERRAALLSQRRAGESDSEHHRSFT